MPIRQTKAKLPKFEEEHWRPVPIVSPELPPEQTLEQLRAAQHIANTNLAMAFDTHQRLVRLIEMYERMLTPHTFQPDMTNPQRPQRCRVCYEPWRDRRHGAVPIHPFAPLRAMGGHGKQVGFTCVTCGLEQDHVAHWKARVRRMHAKGLKK